MRTLRRALTPVLLAAAFAPSLAAAQDAAPAPDSAAAGCKPVAELRWVGLSDARGDVARLAQVAGAAPMRPWLIRRPSSEVSIPLCEEIPAAWAGAQELEITPDTGRRAGEQSGEWRPAAPVGLEIEILPVEALTSYNSAYPKDRNNGALWAGKGLSSAATVGAAFRWKWLSGALRPELTYSANDDFETVQVQRQGYSQYMYPWQQNWIDWPQRPGDEVVSSADLGQSYLRVDAFGAKAGLSTENLWWGSAVRNPIILSNTADGFPHAFVGTSRPIDIWIGKLELEMVWGQLSESGWWDSNPLNDDRTFIGEIATFEPRGLPGLFLGIVRVYHDSVPARGQGFNDLLLKTIDNPLAGKTGNNLGNGIGAVFGRWVLPESQFELYAEWAREDYSLDLDDVLNEPDHSQAYVLGLQKVVELSRSRWIRLHAELSHLDQSISTRTGRKFPTFYTHQMVRQGHTNEGQLLGAAIGPGSSSQYFAGDLFARDSRWGLFLERVRYDTDGYHNTWARNYGFHGYDRELTAGFEFTRRVYGVMVDAGLMYSVRRNRNFIGLDGTSWDFREDRNLSASLQMTWWPLAERD